MGSYNFLTHLIPLKLNWITIEDEKLCNSIINTSAPLGAAIGALTGGFVSTLGRRKSLLIINVVISIAIIVSLIETFETILIGRLFMGMCAGMFSVISPMFISEICPPQYSGPFGIVNQFMVCFGIIVIYLLGIALVPYNGDPTEALLASNSW